MTRREGTTIKKKVLIIDDNLNVCKEIKYALQNETTEVCYALSANEGLQYLTKYRFCLVIMDILLSKADGMELLKIIRQIKPIPILVLSSKPGSEERIAALKAGANGYVEKPYKLEECLAHAQSLMELYAQLYTSESRCYTLAFGMDLIIDPIKHQAKEMSNRCTMAGAVRFKIDGLSRETERKDGEQDSKNMFHSSLNCYLRKDAA